jgi:hypothetical protein
MEAFFRVYSFISLIWIQIKFQFSFVVLTATLAQKTGSVSPHDGPVIHSMMMEAAKNVEQQLSIQELIDIPPPNKDALQRLSFGKLIELSKFLMTEGVLYL